MNWLKAMPLLLLISACTLLESERVIPLSEVPQEILAAAQQAVPGIQIEEAEIEMENGQQVYELSGIAAGQEYEIEISGTGEILEVEED